MLYFIISTIIFSGIVIWYYLKCSKLKSSLHFLKSELLHAEACNENQLAALQNLTTTNTELNALARLVQQSPNAIMLMDSNGNVTYVNKGFEQMYGYNYAEFIAARGSNYRKTSFSPQVQERINRIFATKKPVKYEALNITKNGRELWTQTALMPITDENDTVTGMVTIDTDIHSRITSSDRLIERLEEMNKKIDTMASQFGTLVCETNALFDSIDKLNRLIEQTDQIVNFIKEISDKTKILGINASIEANIAGQYGRGFRVVANEIVEISNKTIQSVSQISKLFSSVSNNQEQILKDKEITANAISCYEAMIAQLKKDIFEIESAVGELKTFN